MEPYIVAARPMIARAKYVSVSLEQAARPTGRAVTHEEFQLHGTLQRFRYN